MKQHCWLRIFFFLWKFHTLNGAWILKIIYAENKYCIATLFLCGYWKPMWRRQTLTVTPNVIKCFLALQFTRQKIVQFCMASDRCCTSLITIVEANRGINKSYEDCYTFSIKQSIDTKINKLKKSKSFCWMPQTDTQNSQSFTDVLSSKHYIYVKKWKIFIQT